MASQEAQNKIVQKAARVRFGTFAVLKHLHANRIIRITKQGLQSPSGKRVQLARPQCELDWKMEAAGNAGGKANSGSCANERGGSMA